MVNGPLWCLFEKQIPIAKRSIKAIHRHVRRVGFRQVSDSSHSIALAHEYKPAP